MATTKEIKEAAEVGAKVGTAVGVFVGAATGAWAFVPIFKWIHQGGMAAVTALDCDTDKMSPWHISC